MKKGTSSGGGRKYRNKAQAMVETRSFQAMRERSPHLEVGWRVVIEDIAGVSIHYGAETRGSALLTAGSKDAKGDQPVFLG